MIADRSPTPDVPPELDPSQQSLAEALKLSFAILKLAIFALLIAYSLSGIFSVGSNEVAMRLRFGDYVGGPEDRVLERGTYIAAPFPFEQVVKVDTRPMTLALDKEFWYEVTADDSGRSRSEMQNRKAGPLHPIRDGSHITGDSGIVHASWTVTWRVGDPVLFLTNVGSKELATGIVRLVAQQGIVQAVAQVVADEFLRGTVDRDLAVGVMQDHLDDMRSGLVIDQLSLDRVSAPMSVAGSFDLVTVAESSRAQQIVAAEQSRARTLGELAGEGSLPLLEALAAYEQAKERGDQQRAAELLSRLDASLEQLEIDGKAISGEVAQTINSAKAYRTQIVEKIRAESEAFAELLPQYEGNPRLVLAKLWEDAREAILTGDVETFYTVPGQLELQLNRDPELQKQRQQKQLQAKKRDQDSRNRGR